MEKSLQEKIAELEIARDRAMSALTAAVQERDMNRSLALQFETELLEERQRIAGRLGNDFGPLIQTIRTLSATVQHRLSSLDASVAQMAALISSNADELTQQMRKLVAELQVADSEDQGLVAAISALIDDWRLRQANRRFELLVSPPGEAFGMGSSEVEAVALRVVKEVLQRIGAYPAVSLIIVSLIAEHGLLSIQISADRPVPEMSAAGPGFTAMIEQFLQGLAGTCHVDSGDAGGCEVVIRLPWESHPV